MCRDSRLSLGITQERLATKVGVTRSHIGKIERGVGNPTVRVMEAMAEALGIELDLVARMPIIHDHPQPRDAVHARCSAYVDRRLRTLDLAAAREVEVVHGRSHGWIDLLAFDERAGTLFLIEIKTRLHDLGAIERQLSWYERSAWAIGRGQGWSAREVRSWLLVLASEEVEASLRANRDLFDHAFPTRAPTMLSDLAGSTPQRQTRRGLAMIDPANRGRQWMHKARIDGRRSPARYAGYADAAGR